MNVEMVTQNMQKNGEVACKLIITTVGLMAQEDWTETTKKAQVQSTEHIEKGFYF